MRGLRGLRSIERLLPGELDACLDDIEHTFARYPLLLLQVVGNESRPFLYDVDWGRSVSLRALHADGGGIVRFRPGAGDDLVRLAPLLRPLIELHWTRMVAAINRIDLDGERLHAHLFGSSRTTFPRALRDGLRDLQDNRCFYCSEPLRGRTELDHFVPWSRWPNDAIENLVLADRCNGHKRDHVAAAIHASRWSARLAVHADDLAAIALDAAWASEADRSLSLARSAYFHLPMGTPLWLRAGTFTDDDPLAISSQLARAG